ncbi:MAG: GHKL domain-containing protein, partial [Oscillospiraceae bacterium]|nr:GHKL domain-containing protein [Oscillospiraceae bacterium]
RILSNVAYEANTISTVGNEIMMGVSYLLIALGLFTILKRETIQAYSERALRHKINEITTDFNSLMQTHDFLSERVHKDAKYLKAFNKALMILIRETPDAGIKKKAQKILDDITEFKMAMQAETQKYNEETAYEVSGMILLDSLMLYMLDLAKEKGIELDIDFQETFGGITHFITEEQFNTLIADLLENAIIAVENSPHLNKRISCSISKDDLGSYQIVIKDSGVAFDKNVLNSIGKRKMTTHKDTGGSGIGLWNVYKTMRSSKASLLIREFMDDLDFTKSVIVKFDGRCEFQYCHDCDNSGYSIKKPSAHS